MTALVRRRSCLAFPGSDPRKLARAARSTADEVILDLEDSVPVSQKLAARDSMSRSLLGSQAQRIAVRVNAPRTHWCHLDIAAVAATARSPLSIVLPKVEHPGDVHFVERLLDGVEAAAGRRTPIRVQVLIESAAGLARATEIAAASDRIESLILGYADLAASLGRTWKAGAARWRYAQDTVLVAARTHGLQAIDGPHLGVADDAAFRAAAHGARELGFDGKWAIHPSQVDALNDIFSPDEEELAHARDVVHALAAAQAGAISLHGQMIDEAVAAAAMRVLAQGTDGESA